MAAAVTIISALALPAQNDTMKSKPEVLVPRPALESVPSMDASKKVLDTLDFDDSGLQIVLYSDNTWKYYKGPGYILDNSVFDEKWTSNYPDSYRIPLDSIPERTTIWVVDTLSDYRCPDIAKIYSPFGYRHGHRHSGVDVPLHTGDPVYAAFAGKVRFSKYYHGYGNLVIIRHENGLETFYAHLSKRNVEEGDWVDAGQQIGLGGATGRATGAHLHFETRYKGYAFDPQRIIDFESGELRNRVFTLDRSYLDIRSRFDSDEKANLLADSKSVNTAREASKSSPASSTSAVYHTIRKGDTLYSLALRYHTSVKRICALNNNLSSGTTLKLGRRIRIK